MYTIVHTLVQACEEHLKLYPYLHCLDCGRWSHDYNLILRLHYLLLFLSQYTMLLPSQIEWESCRNWQAAAE